MGDVRKPESKKKTRKPISGKTILEALTPNRTFEQNNAPWAVRARKQRDTMSPAEAKEFRSTLGMDAFGTLQVMPDNPEAQKRLRDFKERRGKDRK